MLFNRVASLVIGTEGGKGRELKGLRFAFSIEKGATKNPNKCELRIWDMKDSTRADISKIGNVVILKAGYAEDVGAVTIFSGNVTHAVTSREGPDLVTALELKDGFLEFRDKKISISLAEGATVAQAVQALASGFGLAVRELPAEIGAKTYPSGFAFVGRVRDGLEKATENLGLEWSIQNREVQIIKRGGVFKSKAFVLSADSGLINSPKKEDKTMTDKSSSKTGVTVKSTAAGKESNEQENLQTGGYKVESLMQPLMEPGGYVQLKSDIVDGQFFRIEGLVHKGDTHGNEWMTELTLRSPK